MYNCEGDQITTSNRPKHTFHVGSQLGKGIKINEIHEGEMLCEQSTTTTSLPSIFIFKLCCASFTV